MNCRHEQVDLPVFFYIDPEFADDPLMTKVDEITLSYTFFEAKDGESALQLNAS
jgi:cytochrome c oxidase assembly protein subunit 11